MPPTVFPTENEILKAVEDMAYEGMQDVAETVAPPREYGDYSHLGSPIGERAYRPIQLREWPLHTDYRPDELSVRD